MHLRNDGGHILASVVVVTGVLLVAGVATLQLTRSQLHANADEIGEHKAFYVADAGIQRGMAQLDQDRSTARSSLAYTYSATESFGEGSYTVTVAQDPLYPTDPSRKQIDSVGLVGGRQSTTRAHVVVQDSDPCAICFSDSGDCRIVSTVGAATTLFNGLIHGNQNVEFKVVSGAAIDGTGTVNAVGNLVSNSALSLLSTMTANAFRRGTYSTIGVHSDVPLLETGIHFANGTNGHGVQDAGLPVRAFPRPGYDRIRRDPGTVIVNADNPPPFGTWNSGTNTWQYLGTTVFPTTPSVTYYVDGNVNFGTIQLGKATNATIIARGWLAYQSLDLVTGAITVGPTVNIAQGPPGSGSPTVLTVGSGSTQSLHLIGQKEVSVGRPVLSTSPLALDSETNALVAPTGIGLSAAAVGTTTTSLFGYSETSTVWAKIATVNASSGTKVSLIGKGETTLAYTGSLASAVSCPY